MSREIKLRAWSSKRNRYYKIRRIEFDLNGNATHVIVWEEDYLKFNIEHLIIEQYTGLKDKNDRDIYVGDILKITLEDTGEIIYYLRGYREFIIDSIFSANYKFEIIGNIHENKGNENEQSR